MRALHAGAGAIAWLTILAFWTGTVAVELLGTPSAIATVKTAILWGLALLIPALATTGLSGHRLAAGRTDRWSLTKVRRLQFAALNGVLILVPAAVFLAWKAQAGALDATFYAVQAVELVAGAANLTLLGLNARDGWRRRRPLPIRARAWP